MSKQKKSDENKKSPKKIPAEVKKAVEVKQPIQPEINDEDFNISLIDSEMLALTKFPEGALLSFKSQKNEFWIDLDRYKKKIVIKIPKKIGTESFEFSVTQFLALLRKGKKQDD